MYIFASMMVGEELEDNGKLCFLFTGNSTHLKPDEIERLIQHLQKVIKSPDNLIWDELLIRSYGKVSELNKFFKDYLIDKCKLINQDRDDKKLYDLYVLHYIEVVLYANENPDKKINLDDYLTTRDGKEYYMLMKRRK